MRILAILYGALLLGIVGAADLGALAPLVHGLHRVPLGDKVAHLVLAIGLGYFAASFARRPALRLATVRVPLATLVVLAVAVVEEASQRFVAGRTFDLLDLAADFAGLAVGTGLALRRAAGASSSRTDPISDAPGSLSRQRGGGEPRREHDG